MEPMDHFHAILSNPEHPLHELNKLYQAWGEAVEVAMQIFQIPPQVSEEHRQMMSWWRAARSAPAYTAYLAEERRVLASGMHLIYIKLPDPYAGYFALSQI